MQEISEVFEDLEQQTYAFNLQRDVIRVIGPDAGSFLQGQLTQDVLSLGQGQSAWSFLLNPDGKINTWLRVTLGDEEHYLLDLDKGFGEKALSRLLRFKLRTKCELLLEEWDWLALRGKDAHDFLEDSHADLVSAESAWRTCKSLDLIGGKIDRLSGPSYESEEFYEYMRILSGIPTMGAELHEKVIPAETGLIQMSVSFTKGCYTGQELVARIDSRGNNVPKRLMVIEAHNQISIGDEIFVKEVRSGLLTSVAQRGAFTVGLAYISRNVEPPVTGKIRSNPVYIKSQQLDSHVD